MAGTGSAGGLWCLRGLLGGADRADEHDQQGCAAATCLLTTALSAQVCAAAWTGCVGCGR